MPKITEEQKQKILDDPILKSNWKVDKKAHWLIKKIEEYSSTEGEQWKNHPGFLTDEELKGINDSESKSDLQKAIRVFLNNGMREMLYEMIDHEETRRKKQSEVKADLSIVGVKGAVEMKNFSPFDDSPRDNVSADITQSIVKVGSIKLTGDFSPQRQVTVTEEKKIKKSKQLANITIRNTFNSPPPSPSSINVSQITVKEGHALVGNTTGDNTNLSHNTSTYESQIDSESQTSSKSKNIYQTINSEDEVVKQPEVILNELRTKEKLKRKMEEVKKQLEELKNSAKDKLKSKKRFSFAEELEKRNKERELLLQKLLNNQLEITSSERELLERKVGKEELDKLCQVQTTLTSLQRELAVLQEQQAQIETPPK